MLILTAIAIDGNGNEGSLNYSIGSEGSLKFSMAVREEVKFSIALRELALINKLTTKKIQSNVHLALHYITLFVRCVFYDIMYNITHLSNTTILLI